MKLYSLSTKLDFGDYAGKTLKDVFIKDPEYIEECILEIPTFCFNPNNVDALEDLHDKFAFSDEAVEKLESKYDIYEEEENSFDEMDNFSEADLKNLGIVDDIDDDDDFSDGGAGFYDDGFGY
jgi:hypothetical protein